MGMFLATSDSNATKPLPPKSSRRMSDRAKPVFVGRNRLIRHSHFRARAGKALRARSDVGFVHGVAVAEGGEYDDCGEAGFDEEFAGVEEVWWGIF